MNFNDFGVQDFSGCNFFICQFSKIVLEAAYSFVWYLCDEKQLPGNLEMLHIYTAVAAVKNSFTHSLY